MVVTFTNIYRVYKSRSRYSCWVSRSGRGVTTTGCFIATPLASFPLPISDPFSEFHHPVPDAWRSRWNSSASSSNRFPKFGVSDQDNVIDGNSPTLLASPRELTTNKAIQMWLRDATNRPQKHISRYFPAAFSNERSSAFSFYLYDFLMTWGGKAILTVLLNSSFPGEERRIEIFLLLFRRICCDNGYFIPLSYKAKYLFFLHFPLSIKLSEEILTF